MLDFADLPYQFIPPKPNWAVISLARIVNRTLGLPGKNHLLSGITVSGTETFRGLRRDTSARIVFLPNHPTHSDPQLMNEVCRQLDVRPAFMAAYDVFVRSKLNCWVMQRLGSFSVDREGSDRKSMACAGEILARGRYPLVIFPEGNVYLCNDRVTPFVEGAAYIALRAQKALGTDTPVYAVPVSLKYTFTEDVRPQIRNALASIAEPFEASYDPHAPITDEIKRISTSVLTRYLKQRGHVPADPDALADEQVTHAAEQIITALEKKIELTPRAKDDLTARVRRIRAAVHAVRIDTSREIDHPAAAHWADEAILALRILGYSGGYTYENPTLDRVAETVARLREDVTSKSYPPDGRRHAYAHIGDPIDLRDHLESFKAKARTAVTTVTDTCEAICQTGIDTINKQNQHPGATPF